MEKAFQNAHPFFRSMDLRLILFETLLLPPHIHPNIVADRTHIVTCTRVCKAWCEIGVSMLWKHIDDHEKTFGLVLRQFSQDHPVNVADYNLTYKDNFLRISSQGYERYQHYAKYVHSINNYHVNDERDEAFCSVMALLNFRGALFPNLKQLGLTLGRSSKLSFPTQFRTGKITHVKLIGPIFRDTFDAEESVLGEVAEYCPLLQCLSLNGLVDTKYIAETFASAHHLHSIALSIESPKFDDFMLFILHRADTMTSLELRIEGDKFIPVDYHTKTFLKLELFHVGSLSLPDCLPMLLRSFPSAPNLKKFKFKAELAEYVSADTIPIILQAVGEYWRRAPFTDISIDAITVDAIKKLDISPLLHIKGLEGLSLRINARAIANEQFLTIPASWPALRELRLILVRRCMSSFQISPLHLQDFLSLIQQLPNLEDVAAIVDSEKHSNPALFEKLVKPEGDIESSSVDDKGVKHICPNLRRFEMSSSPSSEMKELWVDIFRRMMPNLDVATLRAGMEVSPDGEAIWNEIMEQIGFRHEINALYVRDTARLLEVE